MSTKSGSLSIACVQLGPRKLSIIRSSGVSDIQGLLKYGRAVGTFRIVRYIMGVLYSGVSVKRGSTVFDMATICWLENQFVYHVPIALVHLV